MARLTTFAVAVDVALLTVRDGVLQLLLVEPDARGYQGALALPGGRVLDDENLDQAASRFLRDVAGVRDPEHVEQLRTYGEPERDPRARAVSVAYLALTPAPAHPPGDGERGARYVAMADVTSGVVVLAFDHDRIVPDAVERARGKLEYRPLATAFVEEPFTLAELRGVYEAVWGVALDPANFRRKVIGSPGFVVPTGDKAAPGSGGGRPATLYRRGPAARLHPAMLQPSREG